MRAAEQLARATTTEGPAGHVMRLADLADLPPTLDGHQAAAILGCSYWCLLEMVKVGTSPVAPLHLGRHLRWATIPVLRAVGAEQLVATSPEPEPSVVPLRQVGSARRRSP